MYLKEEKEFLRRLGKKIDKLIDREFDKIGWDRAYFDFVVLTKIYSEDFLTKIDEMIILDTRRKNYCSFCGDPTEYYDSEQDVWLCPKCFAKILQGGGEV